MKKFAVLFSDSECASVNGSVSGLLWEHLRNKNDEIIKFQSKEDAEKIKQIMMESGQYSEEEQHYEIEEC